MKNKFTIFSFGWGLAAGALLLAITMPVTAVAQETTSSIRGSISAPDGSAAGNVTVRVVDTRNGRARTLTTSDSGNFLISGLSVGGPYTVTINSPNFANQTVTDVFLGLGDTYSFNMTLSSETVEEIVVTAAALQSVQVAVGPSTTFNLDDLEQLPAINRDIRDIVRVDPRVYIDEAFVDSVQCIGANPRFNSITVDGVKLNDNFGLNSNGYPTQRQPFPYDAIQNVSVELAPYDVQYGGFTACNTNAVTKSGGNEFSGSVWLDYTDDSFVGDKLEGADIPTGKFDEKRYGFSVGGPILKDRLFFFAAYEKAQTADSFDRCAGDQSCGRPVLGVSQAQVDRIASIARNLYEYEPGDPVLSSPVEDEKYLLKLDWNINDSHRAALTYNYNDGFNLTASDNDSIEYEFSNHFYTRGAELEAYSGQLFSDWNDNFSTELRVGYSKLDNTQVTRNDVGFGEVQIETYFNGQQALVYLGGDDSRQSNKLNYDSKNFKAAGSYTLGDHVISGGFEQETLDIFNLFVQHTTGEYRFDEMCNAGNPDGCIDAFEAFDPDDIYYGNAAPSLNPNDAAANFGYTVNTLYLQDEYTFADYDLTMVAGVRYDWYTSEDLPNENPNFVARNGFSNRQNFDGASLIQPRFGISWDVSDRLSLRGGFGLYSGGNPNVWLGNNYQNDGFTQVQAREGDAGDLDELNIDPNRSLATEPLGVDGNGRPIYDAPQATINFVANGSGNSAVNAVSPTFDPPSNWKFSLGGTYSFDLPGNFGSDYVLSGDVILTRGENSATLVDDTLVQIGEAPDGRPIYFPTDKSVAGCAADPLSNPAGCSRLFNNDYILSNVTGDDTEQLSLSLSLSKEYDWGLDWTLGYAYTESDDINPMTSSVAGSNYFNIAVADPNDPGRATSNYEIPHRAILRVNFEKDFFGDNTTRFTLFGSRNEGRPFSYTFIEQTMFIRGPFFNPDDDRSLLYMPSGPSDPNVIFAPGFDTAAFFQFAESRGLTKYGGQIVPRNAFHSNWWTKFDLKISQEIPGFGDHKAQGYLIVENLGNLLNDDWGVLYEQGFPRTQSTVEASLVDTAGTPTDFSDDQYQFESFREISQSRATSASLWAVRIGFNYRF